MNTLSLPMDPTSNDAEASTVGQYVQELLLKVLHEQERFSGKRPFGNSGWFSCELGPPLIKAGLVKGKLDEDGCVVSCNDVQLASVLREAVVAQFKLIPQ